MRSLSPVSVRKLTALVTMQPRPSLSVVVPVHQSQYHLVALSSLIIGRDLGPSCLWLVCESSLCRCPLPLTASPSTGNNKNHGRGGSYRAVGAAMAKAGTDAVKYDETVPAYSGPKASLCQAVCQPYDFFWNISTEFG